jgi:predicted NBD/HSP70 family sugar kinase
MSTAISPEPDPGLNAGRVRRDNLGRVLWELHLTGSLSRSDLVARTLLDRSTIGGLVEDLVRRGLAVEKAGHGAGLPGRPSAVVQVREDSVRVLSIDIAAPSLAAAVVGLGGRVHGVIRSSQGACQRSPAETIRALEPLVRDLVARAGGRSMIAVGVSVPGVVSPLQGTVDLAPSLGWRRIPLVELVAERLDLDLPVYLGNEAVLAARAEHLRGAGVGVRDLLYVSGEIGGGVILGGRALSSEDGRPGEIGHLPVNPGGQPCECGSRGCWRTEVGAGALLRAGRATTHCDASSSADDIEGVIRATVHGDRQAIQAMDEEGRWLGIGLAGLLNVLGPRRIILGGFLARIFPHVIDRILEEVDRRGLETARTGLEIVPGALGEDAALLGAAELALEPLLADPTLVAAAQITPAS